MSLPGPRPLVHFGNSERMDNLATHSVDLVVTSPPYFPASMASLLEAPRKEQDRPQEVLGAITSFALTFRPVYRELCRVLKPGRAAIFQLRDLRYGGILLPLVNTHWDLLLSEGFCLVTRVLWRPGRSSKHRRSMFVGRPLVGTYLADDCEEFLVFASGTSLEVRSTPVDLEEDPYRLVEPVWTLSAPHRRTDHVWGSPRPVVRRLVSLYSLPGDLVVDPFMGHGNTLEVAQSLGRRSEGWDTDAESYSQALQRFPS